MRYGIVDMGSNAIRTLIAEIGAPGAEPTILQSHREAVRLGQDVFTTGTIAEPMIAAAVETLRRFRERCDELGVTHVRAIATSAMREAANRDLIVDRIRQSTGVDLEVISGSEEAYLQSVAVATRIDLSRGRALLVDLGGGSVECTVVEDANVVSAESYRLGALRVLQALGGADVRGKGVLDLIDRYVHALDGRIREGFGEGRIQRYVATGGNIETLADLLRAAGRTETEKGVEIYPLEALLEQARRIASLSTDERVRTLGLKPDRADTILPAAIVYWRIGKTAGVDSVLVPRVGIRDGLLREVAAGHLTTFRAMDHRATVLSACRALGKKYHVDHAHAQRVHALAASLYDQTHALHRLGMEERILLEAASLLHDIGVFVSNSRHHKHTYYLIRESDLVGLTKRERELVALVARYHRRAHPGRDHDEYESLPRTDRLLVQKLAALLRIADALDREHMGKVADVTVRIGRTEVVLIPAGGEGEGNFALEAWAVEQKGTLWREVFGLPIRFAALAESS